MIARFKDHAYLDVDSISCMVWEGTKGRIFVDGNTITVNWNTFNRIRDAFVWARMGGIYDFRNVSSETYKQKERK